MIVLCMPDTIKAGKDASRRETAARRRETELRRREKKALRQAVLIPFGDRVRVRRLELGLKQREIDDRMGLNGKYVGGIERGVRNPELATLYRLARALDIAPHDLISPPPPTADEPAPADASPPADGSPPADEGAPES